MALVYFDSSALVKLVVEEEGSDLVAALSDGCDAALSSRLAYPEVRAALAAAGRNHDLDERDLAFAERALGRLLGRHPSRRAHACGERSAGGLAKQHGLRGAGAIHLASALAVKTPDLIVAVWDRRLHAGVAAERLALAPATLES